jgi:hypothetical protein
MSASFFERNIYKIINLDYSMTKREVDNSFGIVGVILGLLSIIFIPVSLGFFGMPVITLILGVVGLVFSLKQKKISKNGWAKVGVRLNLIGIVLSLAILIAGILLVRFLVNNPEVMAQFQQGGYNNVAN